VVVVVAIKLCRKGHDMRRDLPSFLNGMVPAFMRRYSVGVLILRKSLASRMVARPVRSVGAGVMDMAWVVVRSWSAEWVDGGGGVAVACEGVGGWLIKMVGRWRCRAWWMSSRSAVSAVRFITISVCGRESVMG